MSWSIAEVWNETLDTGEDRPLEKRDNIWASELGGAYIDRFLKMRAVPYTNPPNARARRKFEAGNLLEWVVQMIFERAGIMQASQEYIKYQYPGLLPVVGKLDFLVGGIPDYAQAKRVLEDLHLPEFFTKVGERLLEYLSKNYPDGLEQMIVEVKSTSANMFEVYELTGASVHHKLQNFHYLKGKNFPDGHIIYICRDDMRLLDHQVLLNDPKLETLYFDDIEKFSHYHQKNIKPPKELPIIWQPDRQRYSANYKVGYSQYLTKLYGFKDQAAFDEVTRPRVSRWNRVVKRALENKDLTANNLEAITEIQTAKLPLPDTINQALDKSNAKTTT